MNRKKLREVPLWFALKTAGRSKKPLLWEWCFSETKLLCEWLKGNLVMSQSCVMSLWLSIAGYG